MIKTQIHTQIKDVLAFLVDDAIRQAELRNLRADHAARRLTGIENRDVVPLHDEIARHGQRSRTGTDTGHALAIFLRNFWHTIGDVVFQIGSHPLQATDGHRILVDTSTTACGLAGAVAHTAKDPGKDIRPPIDHVGFGIAAPGNQPDVFRYGSMGRTRPLAIHYLVVIVVPACIRRFHVFYDSNFDSAKFRRRSAEPLIHNKKTLVKLRKATKPLKSSYFRHPPRPGFPSNG